MAVYMFTLHAYRSWMPDRRQGYVKRDEGILPPDPEEAKRYNERAKHDQVWINATIAAVMIQAVRDVSKEHGWRLHQVRITSTHVHILVSWDGFLDWKSARRAYKHRLTVDLHREIDPDRPFFSRGGSRKRVNDFKHFTYLMTDYLPKHGGWWWREDEKEKDDEGDAGSCGADPAANT
ncbi:MAG: hypothetical protein WD768_22985 [Phycisphaeraceae bacterium]